MKSEEVIRNRLIYLKGREAGEQKEFLRTALSQQILALEWVLELRRDP